MARSSLRAACRIGGGTVVATLALVAAGCGGSSSNAAGTTTASAPAGAASTGRVAAFQAFRRCLEQHGVSTPSFAGRPRTTTGSQRPRTGTGGFFRRNLTAAQQKAYTACRAKLPAGGFRPGSGPGRRNSGAFGRYTQCLKAHGVTFGQASAPGAFQKAQTACAKLRPAVPSRPGTTPTTTGSS